MSRASWGQRWLALATRIRGVLAVLLTIVGLARVIGFYSGLFPLSVLGAQFGASPLPLVFSQVNGIETYSRRFALDLSMGDGRSIHIPGGGSFKRQLWGPFTRVKLYVDMIAFADLSAVHRRRAVLVHAFCHGGPLLAELGIEGDVRVVVLRVWSADDPDVSLRSFEVSCSP